MILLINKNKDANLLPYAEQYRLFDDWHKALEAAVKLGWETGGYGFGINKRVGMQNICQYGDVNLSLMGIEIEKC